ncbi:MAG TPA: glutathione-independent formaldehyde dehydrogenase [Planctomycetota bacterium]|nr:glutathione-independent formaldehyde dehydrogenase [Planctomycetota bacterium]
MKAVVYNGPRDIQIQKVPDARIERPTDVLVRITMSNIGGSDLHMYEGRAEVQKGTVLGHENLGRVIETGTGVERIRVGDWVSLPFNIACGFCRNCERGFTSACLTTNPGSIGAAYGYAQMGSYSGGQAELLRVPFGDFNCLRLPPDAEEKQTDYVMLADVFPTGYHATELAGVQPGESVAVFGAGAIGLMAAYSALLRGAALVLVVDRHPDRLRLAQHIGARTINDALESPAKRILELTQGRGVDRGCECVGVQAHDPGGSEHPERTMNDLVQIVRPTGSIGIVGLFVPDDPQGPDPLATPGKPVFDWGALWRKGLRIGMGACNVKAYNRRLRDLIHAGRAKPSFIVSHRLPLDQAPAAYQHVEARDTGWTKVLLQPQLVL